MLDKLYAREMGMGLTNLRYRQDAVEGDRWTLDIITSITLALQARVIDYKRRTEADMITFPLSAWHVQLS